MSFESKVLHEVINVMASAEMYFLKEIKTSKRNSLEVVNALEQLLYAQAFVRGFNKEIPVCTRCGGIFNRELKAKTVQCLDCDFTWTCETTGDYETSSPTSTTSCLNITETITAMRRVLDILKNRKEPNFEQSLHCLALSIKWAKRHKSLQEKVFDLRNAHFFTGNQVAQSFSR